MELAESTRLPPVVALQPVGAKIFEPFSPFVLLDIFLRCLGGTEERESDQAHGLGGSEIVELKLNNI